MKKIFLYSIMIIIIFVLSITMGYQIQKYRHKESNIDISAKDNNVIQELSSKTVNSSEEKISPNASFTVKKYYKECGHATEEDMELPKELINLSKEEVKEIYKDWVIQELETNEIVLFKEEDGICDKHYILKEKDGFIAIYLLNNNGEETLKEITAISTQYLPESDLNKVKEGIKAYGQEELNSIIEDFE